MYVSTLVGKRVFSRSAERGVCVGVGVSLKTFVVKYLFYQPLHERANVLFALPFARVCAADGLCLQADGVRALSPKGCAPFRLRLPVFTAEGVAVGQVADLSITEGQDGEYRAEFMVLDGGKTIAADEIAVYADAVLLKKSRPYPLGQRIPAPILSLFSDKNQPFVSKAALRRAVERNDLIKFTLSLPPFHAQLF